MLEEARADMKDTDDQHLRKKCKPLAKLAFSKVESSRYTGHSLMGAYLSTLFSVTPLSSVLFR